MIETTIVLLAGALPLRMAAIFTSTVSEQAENFTLKRLANNNYHTCSMIRSKLPCFLRAIPLECRGKGEKCVCPRESTEKSDTSIKKMRVEQKWRNIDMTISHK